MIENLLSQLGTWEAWTIVGFVLIGIEIFAPGFVFLWPGLAALTVALMTAVFAPGWQFELLCFALLSMAYAWLGRRYWRRTAPEAGHSHLNQRGQQLIGKVCVLTEDTTATTGRAQVGDSTWLARCRDDMAPLPSGSTVRIVGVEGTILQVAPHL